jgi:hypothetical protein
MNQNQIIFDAEIDQFQDKCGSLVVKLTADTKKVDKNLLSTIMNTDGGVVVVIKSNQVELVPDERKEADGQTELLED